MDRTFGRTAVLWVVRVLQKVLQNAVLRAEIVEN
jgi:hypothetical protein